MYFLIQSGINAFTTGVHERTHAFKKLFKTFNWILKKYKFCVFFIIVISQLKVQVFRYQIPTHEIFFKQNFMEIFFNHDE